MEATETQLIQEIQRGNPESLAHYLQLRRSDLLAVILSKMGPQLQQKVEADDIYQEVCSNAVRSAPEMTFSNDGPFGWFCELAERRIVDERRKFTSQKRDSDRERGIHGKEGGDPGIVNLLIASVTSPSRAFSRQQKEFQLLEALGQLPETQQVVLDLRYAKGKSTKEIADEIGKSDGATRVLLTRSIRKLKELMESG